MGKAVTEKETLRVTLEFEDGGTIYITPSKVRSTFSVDDTVRLIWNKTDHLKAAREALTVDRTMPSKDDKGRPVDKLLTEAIRKHYEKVEVPEEHSLKRIIKAHGRSSYHRPLIEASELCGCFHCLSTFKPTEIREWVDGVRRGRETHETALCPRCGIDSVLDDMSGYPLTQEFLGAMSDFWFGRAGRKKAEVAKR